MSSQFVTAINCMDGRVQLPVIEWLKKEYNAEFVDMITEPGPNKILSDNTDNILVGSIKNRVDISVNKHLSGIISIIGHYDCAGNPTAKAEQVIQIESAIKTIKLWGFQVPVIGLWVDDNWKVEKCFEE